MKLIWKTTFLIGGDRYELTNNIRIYKCMEEKIIEKELSYKLVGIFFEIQNELGRFCRERQYADLLEKKFIKEKLNFKREYPIEIADRKSNFIDFIIENKILIDLKAKPFIKKDDYYQMKRYLQITNLEIGLVVNFRDEYLKPRRVLNSVKNKSKKIFVDLDKKFVASDRSKGFTIVELLVSMSLFSIIVGIASGVFIQSMRTQRAVVALSAAVSNAQLTIEQMAREIRIGENFSLSGGELNFTNAKGESIIYRLGAEKIERGVNGNFGPLTAENVSVKNLGFVLSGNLPDDGRPPKITLIMQIGTKGSQVENSMINLQVSVSSRVLDG